MQSLLLDAVDIHILDVLQRHGRISNLDLADRVSLSASACLRRTKLLEERGIIGSYQAHLSTEALGLTLEAFVHVSMRNDVPNWHETFTAAIEGWPEIVSVYVITGDSHYLLRVVAPDLKHFSAFILNKLYKAPGVMDIRSNIVLQAVKDTPGAPVGLIRLANTAVG